MIPDRVPHVQVVRFKNNTEVVADLEYIQDQGDSFCTVRFHNTMRFGFIQAPSGTRYLQLAQWNPLSIYKDRFVDIDIREILYASEPSPALEEYYLDVIKQWDLFHEENPDAAFAKIKTVHDMMKDMEEFAAGDDDSEGADDESLGDISSSKKLN